MAIRLGDLLVQNSVISPVQLDEALKAQKAYGGRLGTNLVELGYITEQALAKFLSVQLKIPPAGAAELDDVPLTVLGLLSPELVEKFRVVPVALNGRKLSVAMVDPTDLRAIDELAFRTGYSVQPLIAPDMLLTYALEKHYGVRRPSRYIRLTGTSDSEFQVIQPQGGFDAAATPDNSGVVQEDRGAFLGLTHAEFATQTFSLADAARDLAACQQPADTLKVMEHFLAGYMSCSVLLTLRGDRLRGHSGQRLLTSDAAVRAYSAAPHESPLLAQITQTLKVGFFDCTSSGTDAQLAALLGAGPGDRVLAVPMIVNSQLVGLYFCAGVRGAEQDAVTQVQIVATKASYSLQMIYLRKRILET